MISDFQQLLDLNGVQYITEGDGRLIADCPLCSEDGRQSKLTIFPDGNLSCVRFASVGGEELKRHNTEIKKIWQAGSDDADSLTSILFDGTLTLAIRPEGKSCFVQATNCNKVLHIDNFNPTIAAKRTAFVNKLPGYSDEQKNEIREALVELAVRARATQAVIDNVPESRTVAAVSIRLEDGRCAELTTRGFAVYDPATRSTGYATSLEDSDGTIYIPLVTKEGAKNIGLYLPTGVDEYHTEGELNKEV